MAFDPDLAIADAKFHSNTEVLAYIYSASDPPCLALPKSPVSSSLDNI